MTPGQYTQDSEGKWVMTPKDQALVDGLLKDGNLSDGDDVKTYLYNMVEHIESSYRQGTLMVDLGEESVIYTEMCPVKFEQGLVLLEYNLGLSATGYCYILAEIRSPLRQLSLAILSRFIDEIPATRQLQLIDL